MGTQQAFQKHHYSELVLRSAGTTALDRSGRNFGAVFASSKNTQDKLGYHLLREDYARAIGDTELEKQERLLSEQLKTQLGNKKGESRIPASAKESKYAFFCWLSFSVGLALFGIISNIATGDSILGSFGAGVFILGLFSFPVCLIWLILWLIRRRKEAAK